MNLVSKLIPWYLEVRRPLPWRANRDAYRIWVSEVMLQQTTVAAVVPYYERFMNRFPDLNTLAHAPEEAVLEHWAGLGYYSRARSLHKSAKELARRGGFPKTFEELIELPGFGPYTARAVASLAFGQNVGVVDGNVIRVLSRVFDLDLEWWKTKDRDRVQEKADELAQAKHEGRIVDASDVNQALMELGASICRPQSPSCMICPWNRECLARKNETILLRPKPKPRRETEIWLWEPRIVQRPGKQHQDKHLLLVKNEYAPFLKGHWMWPGQARRLKKKPANFHFKGSVTHHDIYVFVTQANAKEARTFEASSKDPIWISREEMKTKVPSSLVRKAFDIVEKI